MMEPSRPYVARSSSTSRWCAPLRREAQLVRGIQNDLGLPLVQPDLASDLHPLAPVAGEVAELSRGGREHDAGKHLIGISALEVQEVSALGRFEDDGD